MASMFVVRHVLYLSICIVSILVSGSSKEGIIIIPGLGRSDRLDTVIHNLYLLSDFIMGPSSTWDCLVYIYAEYNDTRFWINEEKLDILYAICDVVEYPGKRVTENLHLAQPALLRNSYQYVFALLDDCKLLGKDVFALDKMIHVMQVNALTVASPLVVGANKGGGQKFRDILQAPPQPGTVGYESVFVEWFSWVMTVDAYEILWELLAPTVNPYGWGYDLWFNNYAKMFIANKMGIVSAIRTKHEQDFGAFNGGRTETASIDTKWAGVMRQEKDYRDHFGVNLRKCRQSLGLSNSSWNGAVVGYLYAPGLDFEDTKAVETQVKTLQDLRSLKLFREHYENFLVTKGPNRGNGRASSKGRPSLRHEKEQYRGSASSPGAETGIIKVPKRKPRPKMGPGQKGSKQAYRQVPG
jgi:hypothetical protein